MTDNLPVIKSSQELTGNKPASSTLLGRGLTAIQNRKSALILLIEHQEEIYQHARLSFNLLTDYGDRNCFSGECWQDEELEQLLSCFDSLKKLADASYGKVYFPLYHLFQGGPSAHRNQALANHYAKLAFDWCFDNQFYGDPEVWNDLGSLYRLGAGCEMDLELAMYWYRQAADAENAEGMFNLSGMYEFGVGVEEDLETAHYWQVKAAEAGHAYAQHGLAFQYHHGLNEQYEQDEELAFYWYLRAAVRGYERATYGVRELSDYGFGLPPGDSLAFNWIIHRAESDEVWAQLFLANAYIKGLGIEQDYRSGVFWNLKAAENGSPEAQFHLGLIYAQARYGNQKNCELALKWYFKSAENGYAPAQETLGLAFANGTLGLGQNDEKSVFWRLKALEQEYSPTLFNLGEFYGQARHGTLQDDQQAMRSFQKLADQGNMKAQFNLGRMYEHGFGIEQDTEKAKIWYQKSAQYGYSRAVKALARLTRPK